jgi:hypothetical protein
MITTITEIALRKELEDAQYAGRLIVQRCDRLVQERDMLRDQLHTCGPDCSKAGCVNRRLREERDALALDYKTAVKQRNQYQVAADKLAAECKVLRDAARLALDAFLNHSEAKCIAAITALKEALK